MLLVLHLIGQILCKVVVLFPIESYGLIPYSFKSAQLFLDVGLIWVDDGAFLKELLVVGGTELADVAVDKVNRPSFVGLIWSEVHGGEEMVLGIEGIGLVRAVLPLSM